MARSGHAGRGVSCDGMIKTGANDMKLKSVLLGTVLVGLSFAGGVRLAEAGVILDTINGNSFAGYSGWYVDGDPYDQSIALPFSSAGNTVIADVTAFIGGGSGQITLGIMADAAGLPSGTFINSSTVTVGSSPITLSGLDWSISGGTTYWLVAVGSAGSDLAWNFSGNGPFAYSQTLGAAGGTWSGYTGGLPEATISSVPEASTWIMMLAGFAGLGFVGYRRNKVATLAA